LTVLAGHLLSKGKYSSPNVEREESYIIHFN